MTHSELERLLMEAWELLSLTLYVDPDQYNERFKLRAEFHVTVTSVAKVVMDKLEQAQEALESWR